MRKFMHPFLWIALCLAIFLGALWQFYPIPSASDRMARLPLYGVAYTGKDIELNSFEEIFFKNVNVVKRVYKIGGQNLFVTALDGTRNRHLVHDPYYCFRGSGWEVVSEKPLQIPGGVASLVNLKNDKESKEAIFWFSNGKEHYSSPLKYWWETVLRRLTLGRSGPEPILILVQPLNDEKVDWSQLAVQFPELFTI